jgi:hypothetical protein
VEQGAFEQRGAAGRGRVASLTNWGRRGAGAATRGDFTAALAAVHAVHAGADFVEHGNALARVATGAAAPGTASAVAPATRGGGNRGGCGRRSRGGRWLEIGPGQAGRGHEQKGGIHSTQPPSREWGPWPAAGQGPGKTFSPRPNRFGSLHRRRQKEAAAGTEDVTVSSTAAARPLSNLNGTS